MAPARSKWLLRISTHLGIAGLASVLGACDYYLERPAEDDPTVANDASVETGPPAEDAAAAPDAAAPDARDQSAPPVPTFGIGGSITGLTGTGLVLQNNGGDDIAISTNGTFFFPTKLASGVAFAVTVKTQPTGQTCNVSGGTGTTNVGNVSSVTINCATNLFTLSGTIAGLSGAGLVLQNNGAGDLAVNSNGTFAFAETATKDTPYAVTVKTQPSNPSQTCVVTNGTGTMPSANVTDVSVTCTTDAFVIGGTVTGLAGTGLVLQNNGADDLAVAADGTFAFTAPVLSGQPFTVTIKTQPISPTQTCQVTGGTGTVGGGNVSSVTVDCAVDKFAVGGTASGIVGAGPVLQNNGGDDLPVTANGTFAFPTTLNSGAPYAVTVKTQPTNPAQTCALTDATGNVGAGPVTNVGLTCTTNTYAVGGTVSGLAGSGLVLQNGGGDDRAIIADGAYFFPTPVASGAGYLVTIKTQPTNPSQTCVVSNPGGTVGAADVNDVAITCTTDAFSVSGTVTGLTGTVVFTNNGADPITMNADGPFTFNTKVASGAPYAVKVTTHPAGKYCGVTNGTGTIGAADVTNVVLSCGAMPYATGVLNVGGNPIGNRRTVFAYAPAGTTFTSNGDYAAYCNSLGFTQNQNSVPAQEMTSAGMVNASAYYCSYACCYLGQGNSMSNYLIDFQNFGLPLDTALSVFDRGCGNYGGTFEKGLVTVDSLTVTSETSFSYTPNAYGAANYGQSKSTVLAREGVIVCQEN